MGFVCDSTQVMVVLDRRLALLTVDDCGRCCERVGILLCRGRGSQNSCGASSVVLAPCWLSGSAASKVGGGGLVAARTLPLLMLSW